MKRQSSYRSQTIVATSWPILLALYKELALCLIYHFIRYGNTNLNVLLLQPCILSIYRG
jgi:hypothetical protein